MADMCSHHEDKKKKVFATVWTRFHPINDEQEATSNE
jgi:hypothetical protein